MCTTYPKRLSMTTRIFPYGIPSLFPIHHYPLAASCLLGKRGKLVDGFTFTMPDTLDNQEGFPQSVSQKPNLGFPIIELFFLRCHVLFSSLPARLVSNKSQTLLETNIDMPP